MKTHQVFAIETILLVSVVQPVDSVTRPLSGLMVVIYYAVAGDISRNLMWLGNVAVVHFIGVVRSSVKYARGLKLNIRVCEYN